MKNNDEIILEQQLKINNDSNNDNNNITSITFLYTRLKNGTYYAVAMSVRSSVRPSAFSGLFFNMLWDINLKLGIYIQ